MFEILWGNYFPLTLVGKHFLDIITLGRNCHFATFPWDSLDMDLSFCYKMLISEQMKGRELVWRLVWLVHQDEENYRLQLERAVSFINHFSYDSLGVHSHECL